jgi:phosphatidylserine/phosphatidylglycerophosphate/cardiolipin synthase-like enzyme
MEALGKVKDLNRAVCREPLEAVWAEGVALRAYFTDLEARVVERILEADVIVGCVAWLTNPRILSALAAVPRGVSIIVQKEEFLRPDLDVRDRDGWRSDLRTRYEALRTLECWPDTLNMATYALVDELRIQPVRCVGMLREGSPAQPRMHHKFLVFCKQQSATSTSAAGGTESASWPEPFAVWTGSFNFTINGCHSLENAVFIKDKRIAKGFYQEWQNVAWLSEPLDWTSRWVNQEWSVT